MACGILLVTPQFYKIFYPETIVHDFIMSYNFAYILKRGIFRPNYMQPESPKKEETYFSKKKFPNSGEYWKFTRFINSEVIFDLVNHSIYWALTTDKC